MSALTLLSVIAPAVASAPQGRAGEPESGFQTLLADALEGETPAVAGLLIPPTTPPRAVLIAGEQGGTESGSTRAAVGIGGVVADLVPSPGTDGGDGRDGAQATTPLLVDTDPTPKTSDPQIQPRLPDAPAKTSEPQVQPRLSEIAAKVGDPQVQPRLSDITAKAGEPQVQPRLSDVTAKAGEPQVQPRPGDIRSGNGPIPEIPAAMPSGGDATEAVQVSARTGAFLPASSSALPVGAPPAPVRPLADRTPRTVDATSLRTGDGSGASRSASAVVGPAASAVTPTAADQPARPADFAASAVGREVATENGGGDAASEPPPLEEGATARTQAATATREPAVSQLSRVAIEATAQIAAQILRRLEGRSTRFEMALTPEELGRVDVKLDIDSEGRLAARLAFDNPAAATDLRGRADELRRQLEEAGFHLADDALEFAERDTGSSAFDRGQDSRNGSSRAFADASRLNAEIDVDQPPRWLTLSLSPSGVDMKV